MRQYLLNCFLILWLVFISGCSDVETPVGKMPPVLKIGEMAPEIIFQSLMSDGNIDDRLTNYRGKVIYLDFWASWCKPCLTSMPLLDKMRKELGNDEFEILAINLDNDPNNGRDFLVKYPVDYPVVHTAELDIYKLYQINVLPASYLIDKQGVLRYAHQGFKANDISKIRHEVMLLLK